MKLTVNTCENSNKITFILHDTIAIVNQFETVRAYLLA